MREQRPRPRPGTREGVILFSVGGFKFAVAAGAVNEIRGMEGLQDFTLAGIPHRLEKLKHTLERGGTTYFVVDAARHFHLPRSKPGRVLILRNTPTAVLVDATDRMLDIFALHALPRAFTGDERFWYRGLAILNGEVVPVVNHAAFLSKPELELLRDGLERVRGLTSA
jgi:chemotaxis signal transduction protein